MKLKRHRLESNKREKRVETLQIRQGVATTQGSSWPVFRP